MLYENLLLMFFPFSFRQSKFFILKLDKTCISINKNNKNIKVEKKQSIVDYCLGMA
jgi:hypothetical protein